MCSEQLVRWKMTIHHDTDSQTVPAWICVEGSPATLGTSGITWPKDAKSVPVWVWKNSTTTEPSNTNMPIEPVRLQDQIFGQFRHPGTSSKRRHSSYTDYTDNTGTTFSLAKRLTFQASWSSRQHLRDWWRQSLDSEWQFFWCQEDYDIAKVFHVSNYIL